MKRVYIDRLDLDLRGLPPAQARAALDRLAPALARAIEPAALQSQQVGRIDAAPIKGAPSADGLAHAIAARVARALSGS